MSTEIVGLEKELLEQILEICRCEPGLEAGLTPDSPILGPDSELGLDSLDAMEIVVMLKERYGIRITRTQSRTVLATLQSMAEYIRNASPSAT